MAKTPKAPVLSSLTRIISDPVITPPTSPGFIGSTRPYAWVNSAYSPQLAQMAARVAASAPSAVRFKAATDGMLVHSDSYNYGFPSWYTALMYQVLGTATYANYSVNDTVVPSLNNNFVGGVDKLIDAENALEAAFTGSGAVPAWATDDFYHTRDLYLNVALVFDWCYNTLTPAQRTKWINYYNNALTQCWSTAPKVNGHTLPGNYVSFALQNQFSGSNGPGGVNGTDGLVGVDPADNYFFGHELATVLAYVAFGPDNPQGLTWRSKFRDVMWTGHMLPYLLSLKGGGGQEGTGYGAAMGDLSQCLDIWEKSTGEDLRSQCGTFFDDQTRYWAHIIVPTLDYICPYGDQSRDSTGALFDTHRNILQFNITKYPTTVASQCALDLLNNSTLKVNSYSADYVADFMRDMTALTSQPRANLGLFWKADSAGHTQIRSDWTKTATLLSLSAGWMVEGHDHFDKGAFLLYKNTWLAYDQVMNTGSGLEGGLSTSAGAATDYHNLVSFVGVTQKFNQANAAPTLLFWEPNTNGYYYHSYDYAPAWNSPVTKAKREYVYIAPGVVVIFDYCTTSSAITKRWQLNTPYVPALSGASAAFTGNASTPFKLTMIEGGNPAVFDWGTVSGTQANYLGTRGKRIDVTQTGNAVAFLSVIDVGATLSSAVAGSNGAGEHTVVLTFAAGGTKTIKFYEANTHALVS